jgi:hypothetical protein
MASGLYQNHEIVERFLAAYAAGPVAQFFVAPMDFDVVGMLIGANVAPGGTNFVTVNVSDVPTSQQGGPGVNANVAAYNLWTAANVPTLTGTAKVSLPVQQPGIIQNQPYSLNYPLPGPAGTQGFVTSQQTTLTTINPVLTPPTVYKYSVGALVAPDNTYTDYNGIVGAPASYVHAGDVLSFVLGGTPGAAAGLSMELVLSKR